MMDRFKFRVWDKWKKAYWPEPGKYFFVTPEGELRPIFRENGIIEQCSGLKDRNGRLIYEGDVVRVYDISGEVFKEGIVCWRDTAFGIVDQNTQAGFACPCLPVDIEADYFLCEVIGNIHEVK